MKYKVFIIVLLLLMLPSSAALPCSVHAEVKPWDWEWETFGPRADSQLFKIIIAYESRLAAFEADEIDVVGVRPEDVERVRKNRPDAFFYTSQAYTTFSIYFNMRRWPLSHPAIRHALAHTLNKEGYILPEILKGYGVMLETVIMPTLGVWHNPNVTMYEYGLEEANKILDKAGFVRGPDGWRIDPTTNKPIRPLNVLTATEALAPTSFAIAVHFAKQCEKIGIKITHDAVESAAVRMKRVRDTHEFDMYHWGWVGIGPESDWPYRFFHSKFDRPGGWNRYGIRNATLDKLLERFVDTSDSEEAKEVLWKAQVILQEELPWIPVYSSVSIVAVSGKLRGRVFFEAPGLTVPLGTSWLSDLNEHTIAMPFGASLRRAVASVENLNPATYIWLDEATVMSHIYEWSAISHPKYAGDYRKALPRLVQKYDIEYPEVKPGVKVTKVTLHFARNITWHDGVPFTAHDANFTVWRLGKELKMYRYVLDWIEKTYKTEVKDDYTFTVYVNSTSWLILPYIISPRYMPKHIWEKLKEPAKLDLARERHPTNPMLTTLTGNGPFIMYDYVPGSYVVNIWNPLYYLPHPEKALKIETVRLPHKAYDDETFEISFKVTDYVGRAVENATLNLAFLVDEKVKKEVTLSNVGGGIYTAIISMLPAASYKLELTATQPLPLGSLKREMAYSLSTEAAIMRYVPYIAGIVVVAVIVSGGFLLYKRRRIAEKA
ncbi:MAG: Bacterial extracellular solute-binding protein, family 5 Middle [Candidatus Bathyarchaeota archaeon BA1]|nr:MAG: Bacterial extracellular solute-binding protein, family 5 Middle [Candidatus Bathyarchaeota archaeon BA1]